MRKLPQNPGSPEALELPVNRALISWRMFCCLLPQEVFGSLTKSLQNCICTILGSFSQPEDPSKFKMLLFALLFLPEFYRLLGVQGLLDKSDFTHVGFQNRKMFKELDLTAFSSKKPQGPSKLIFTFSHCGSDTG